MIFTGKPTDEMINTYKILLTAQEKTVKQLELDNNPVSVDQYCRKFISDKELPIYQHSTGHGVGLQIHEYPKISFTSTDVLLPNQVVTVEPGVYLENKWGMRIEDTVSIKEKQIEVLTNFSKKILIRSF
jgi:Xaa-Pro aminopeptidase